MTAPLVAAPALLPGESVLHYVNARWTRTRHTHHGRSAHRSREAAGTLFLTDFRLLWVPQPRAHSHSHHHHSSSDKGSGSACCVCLCEDAAYPAARNGVVSVPYTTIEDVAFTAEDGTDVLAQEHPPGQSQIWRGPVRMKIETKCFVHAEFRFAPAVPEEPPTEAGSDDATTATTTKTTATKTKQPEGSYEAWRVAARLVEGLALAGAQQPERVFAGRYRAHPACAAQARDGDGWRVFDAAAEWARLALAPRAGWRVSALNARYHVCEGYPSALAVPASVDDDALARCAARHVAGRFPVAVWRHPVSGAILARASALLPDASSASASVPDSEMSLQTASAGVRAGVVGCGARDAGKDGFAVEQEIVRCIRMASMENSGSGNKSNGTNGGYIAIMDARARTPTAGAGRHERAHVICLSLADTHVLRESKNRLRRLILACSAGNGARAPDVGAGLGATGWLQHVRQLLTAAQRAAASLAAGTSVLAVCATGCDQSAQLASLTELLADARARTLHGFARLVEKHWVAFGHRFALRHGLGRLEDSACAPLFLQFLDCVHQVRAQHPAAFEFNDAFLVALATEAYAARTGTFLANSAHQRAVRGLAARTAAFWTIADAARARYTSPEYVPVPSDSTAVDSEPPLPVRCDAAGITLWKAFYLRHSPVVAENVAFDRPLLDREPIAVTRALADPDSAGASDGCGTALGRAGSLGAAAAATTARRRSISSSAGAARAVAVEAFVAENDGGSREVARGQEVFLLEKVSEDVWFISTDARRTFMAHVPARHLRECAPSIPAAVAAAASASASPQRSRAVSRLVPEGAVPARTRSAAGPPPLHQRHSSVPVVGESAATRTDKWQGASIALSTRTTPHERFLLARQQQGVSSRPNNKDKEVVVEVVADKEKEKEEEKKEKEGPPASWTELKQRHMAAGHRLCPINERVAARGARVTPPWAAAAQRTLALRHPPSQLVSSLLSPRTTLLPAAPPVIAHSPVSLENGDTPRVVLPQRPPITPAALTAAPTTNKVQTRFKRSRTALTIVPVRENDLGSGGFCNTTSSASSANSVWSPTTVITSRTVPVQHSHLQLLRRAALMAQGRNRTGTCAGPLIGTSRVRSPATPPTPVSAHGHSRRGSERDSSSATSSESGDDVSLSDLSAGDDESSSEAGCSPWFCALRTPSPSPSPAMSPPLPSPTEPRPLDRAGLRSSSKRFLLSLFRSSSKKRLDAPGSPTSPTGDATPVTPITPTVHPPVVAFSKK